VQSDWQRSAYEGTESFAGSGSMTDLRSVMSLYPEAVTLLASAESGIAKLTDVPGKRIDVGHPASGRHATVMRLLGALGLGRADFAALLELQAGGAVDELCAGRIDATVLIVGHPNATVARAIETCGAVLIPFRGPLVDSVFGKSTDYVAATIASGTYPSLATGIPTYAVMATIVTRSAEPPDIVEALVAETLAALPELAVRAPLLEDLAPEDMRTLGLTAPLHPGAVAAFDGLSAGG
jgi:uncharacterized protein